MSNDCPSLLHVLKDRVKDVEENVRMVMFENQTWSQSDGDGPTRTSVNTCKHEKHVRDKLVIVGAQIYITNTQSNSTLGLKTGPGTLCYTKSAHYSLTWCLFAFSFQPVLHD